MKSKLVSVLTPCYNGANHIFRLLDSILMQTYPHIEMFVIDDGSSDHTAEIVKSYQKKFKDKGYLLFYHYQENQGQSAAINNGLKLVNGEYLVWPDADDYYSKENAISLMVNALIQTPQDVAVVRGFAQYVDEKKFKYLFRTRKRCKNEDLFLDLIFHKRGYWFQPSMVKTNNLFSVLPLKSIYVAKNAGQNLQLLMPLMYKYKSITIPEILFTYVERTASHSRNKSNNVYNRLKDYEQTVITILHDINPQNIDFLECKVRKMFLNNRYDYALKVGDVNEIEKCKNKMLKNYSSLITMQDRIDFILDSSPQKRKLLLRVKKIKRRIKTVINKVFF